MNNILGNITFRITNSADTVDELLTATTFSIFNYLLGIPLALLAIRVIKDYAKAEPFFAKLQKPGEVQEKTSIEQSIVYQRTPNPKQLHRPYPLSVRKIIFEYIFYLI